MRRCKRLVDPAIRDEIFSPSSRMAPLAWRIEARSKRSQPELIASFVLATFFPPGSRRLALESSTQFRPIAKP